MGTELILCGPGHYLQRWQFTYTCLVAQNKTQVIHEIIQLLFNVVPKLVFTNFTIYQNYINHNNAKQ